MSFDKSLVRVFNYGRSGVSLPTRDDSVYLRGAEDPNFPVMETFAFADLEYMNTHSSAIRSGIVEFAQEEREEIYSALKINDWQERCFFEGEIDKMLASANFNTMERVIAITDIATIDRIYSHMMKLINSGSVDVSTRVQKVVEARRKELYNEVLTSRIKLVQKKEEPAVSQDEVERLVAQKVAEQLAMLQQQAATAQSAEESSAEVKTAEVKKPVVKKTTATKKPATKKPAAKAATTADK